MSRHDDIVAGSGRNGLAAACSLARAGLKTVVLEKNRWAGRAAVSRALCSGFACSHCIHATSLPRRRATPPGLF